MREEWRDINSYCKHRMLGYPCKKEYVSVANENGQVQRVVRNYVDDFAQCPGMIFMHLLKWTNLAQLGPFSNV